MRLRHLLAVLSAWALLALPGLALANGQSTHIWISAEALSLLPPGPLAEVLTAPEALTPLVNGTMFPDWGYASGDRDHGEASHWEPLQQEYLSWIQETFEPPYSSPEALPHVAFLFGMASHGMADEHFDSLFMERSRCYDDGWSMDDVASLDTASDVLFMAQVGGIPTPEPWLPTDALLAVYQRAMPDLPLDIDGLEWGNRLLHVAVASVEALRKNEERITTFTALYPWSAERFLDASVPGSPPTEAVAVAAYWQALWRRLQGTATFDEPVAMMTPAPDSFGHALTSDKPEGRLHLAFAHGVSAATLDRVTVSRADGAPVSAEVSHFYGDFSHAVLVRPDEDWAPDSDYVLTVGAGVADLDGRVSSTPWTAAFSTRPDPGPQTPDSDDPTPETPAPGCNSIAPLGSPPWWLALGVLLYVSASSQAPRRRAT